jgi:hypothetical protein
MVDFELTFNGGMADNGLIEFYDAAKALSGFQRSLALTTHLVLHGEIITQAPTAHGFQIFLPPFLEGSWKARAKIVIGGAFLVGSVGKDSPVGHIVTSIYDAALSATMGISVDYDKTLQQLYRENQTDNHISPEKIDSLCEKIETSVADMHRPIIKSKSASRAQVSKCGPAGRDVGPILNLSTYEYVQQTIKKEDISTLQGYVSGYNINTFKGRVFCKSENRPIPFELVESARTKNTVGILTRSQHMNGQAPFSNEALVEITCQEMLSLSGRAKKYIVFSARAID